LERRGLLLGSFGIVTAYILISDSAARMTRREKAVAVVFVASALLVVERLERWHQPKPEPEHIPAHRPMPPLMLMLTPAEDFWTEPVFTSVPNQPVAVSFLSRPQGGHAGFSSNEADDPMLGVPDVEFVNLSDKPVTIDWVPERQWRGSLLQGFRHWEGPLESPAQ
jgi:hypothetical protein